MMRHKLTPIHEYDRSNSLACVVSRAITWSVATNVVGKCFDCQD